MNRARRHSDESIQAARRAAMRLRDTFGWNCLPSYRDTRGNKRPAIDGGYVQYRSEMVPADWADEGGSWWTPAIQVITGWAFGLAIVDCDGDQGCAWFARLSRACGLARTWVSSTPGGGLHYWFTVPEGVTELPSPVLWKGEGRHQGVELLADGKQVPAPPSIYEGLPPYRWVVGPEDLPGPAVLPDWILAMAQPLQPEDFARTLPEPTRRNCTRGSYDWRAVLAAIPDMAAVGSWAGLRLSGKPHKGWVDCRAIGREDKNPSARFSVETGRYWDPWLGTKPISLFEVARALRGFASLGDAIDAVGAHVGAPTRP